MWHECVCVSVTFAWTVPNDKCVYYQRLKNTIMSSWQGYGEIGTITHCWCEGKLFQCLWRSVRLCLAEEREFFWLLAVPHSSVSLGFCLPPNSWVNTRPLVNILSISVQRLQLSSGPTRTFPIPGIIACYKTKEVFSVQSFYKWKKNNKTEWKLLDLV